MKKFLNPYKNASTAVLRSSDRDAEHRAASITVTKGTILNTIFRLSDSLGAVA